MLDTPVAKVRLEEQLAELERREQQIAAELCEPPNPDWDEQAIEMEDEETLQRQGALVERQIGSIRRALGRIERGTYGVCVTCGGEIAPARLAARPEAALCIDCARSAE